MRLLLAPITILFFVPLCAQQVNPLPAPIHKIKAGVLFSQDLDYRVLANNEGSESIAQLIDFLNKTESMKIGYTAGLDVSMRLKKNMSLAGGIHYSNKGYQNVQRDLVIQMPDMNPIIYAKYIYNYHFIDMPLGIRFAYGHKKFRFITGAGLTTNILLNETQTAIYRYEHGQKEVHSTPTHYKYNTINISPGISLGFEYQKHDEMKARIEPFFEYGILRLANGPITSHLWSAGIRFSYYFLSL